MNRPFLALLHALIFQCCLVYGNNTKHNLEEAYGKAVAGDIQLVLSVLNSIEDVRQSDFADVYEKYESRFITAEEQCEFDDPFIAHIYNAYTKYWRASLLDQKDEKKHGKNLYRILIDWRNRMAIKQRY